MDKVREKTEMGEMLEVVLDHGGTDFWHANLRNHDSKVATKRNESEPRNSREYEDLMTMKRNSKPT